ncbi:hypothetical protein FF38_05802 [Lucilia cuprina]|uniref:MADF domain-containing protein n=1 Tax=Lucilia cuprina TaxID=7375 RepID=A0A0L0C2D7_LUCCU|nr:hypothetical protein FF38_05802 [Lucilia cuprina]
MVGDRSIQVLNISNVNAQGKTVLNDGKLLDLIQKYPFLYNPRVRAYNDNDYSVWAWKNINAAFNRSYSNDPNAAFSTGDLMHRWEVLKPLIQCLSKAYDLEAIPKSLRNSVVKISTELDDQSCSTTPRPSSMPQNLLLQNICSISKLNMDKRLALERDILDLILSAELEGKQATKLDAASWSEVYEEADDFLNDIGFKQVLLTSVNHQEKIFYPNNVNQHSIRDYAKSRKSRGWVPLKDVHKFIKPCHVRLERINVEDYLPLAKMIKLEKHKSKNVKKEISNMESLEIFGI